MNELLWQILAQIDHGILVVDETLRIRYANRLVSNNVDASRGSIIGSSVDTVIPLFAKELYRQAVQGVLETGQSVYLSSAFHDCFLPLSDKDASPQNMDIRQIRVGDRSYAIIQIHDMTKQDQQIKSLNAEIIERRKVEAALRDSEAYLQALISQTPAVIYSYTLGPDEMPRLQYINDNVTTVLGYRPQDLLEGVNLWKRYVHPDDRQTLRRKLAGDDTIDEYRLQDNQGEYHWLYDQQRVFRSENGVKEVVGTWWDITDRKQKQEAIEYLSLHDQLTGLHNRRYFDEQMPRIDTRENLPISVVMLDVNGLKLTNDAFGHAAGDELLRKVADIVKRQAGAGATIARLGGDEFVILLPDTDETAAMRLTERLGALFADDTVRSIPISVSCGWATKTDQHENFADVYKQAEDAMYRQKLSERHSRRHESIQLIVKTLYEKSPREQKHSSRVSQLSRRLALALDLPEPEVQNLELAGLLHDIGKITVSNEILNHPGVLSEAEWQQIRRHSEAGYSILSAVNDYAPLAEGVVSLHERWDGRGYPRGLKGDTIPVSSRIMAVVDAYDAMVSERPYRQPMSPKSALDEIRRSAGSHFDPQIAQAFVDMMERSATTAVSEG